MVGMYHGKHIYEVKGFSMVGQCGCVYDEEEEIGGHPGATELPGALGYLSILQHVHCAVLFLCITFYSVYYTDILSATIHLQHVQYYSSVSNCPLYIIIIIIIIQKCLHLGYHSHCISLASLYTVH